MSNPIFNSPKRVGLKEAVSRFFAGYINFSGRSSRSEYWLSYAFLVLIGFLIGVLGGGLGMSDNSFKVLIDIMVLVLLLPAIAVAVRRLHDTGKSGWLILIGIIPFASLVLLAFYCIEGDAGANQYGEGYQN